MARPPNSIPPTTSNPLKVSLIVGSFVHDPVTFDLFDLQLPVSQPAPQHPEEASFHPRPLIEHTFRPEQKLPPKTISMVFTALVVSPWIVLLGLVCTVHLVSLNKYKTSVRSVGKHRPARASSLLT